MTGAPATPVVPGSEDTIAALASAPGRGALALLRLSGPDAFAVASRVLRPWPLEARRATLCAVRDPADARLLDRALATAFPGPASYTGEDLVEITTHGGAVVPASVLAALVSAGARPALPGEFTRRAVLNGRLDLLQAEAVGDLVDARSSAAQAAALGQMSGLLSRQVATLRERLLGIEALLAYDIDFPEEDDGPVPRSRVAEACAAALAAVDALLATAPAGAVLRDGALVVIAGPPNAGKSSLFNALLGQERAIVTDVPGTTRDAIEAVLDTRPWPLRLVDTAGLRETADAVERLGIEVSARYLREAAVVVGCAESAGEAARVAAAMAERTVAPVVAVRTKADLGERGAPPELHDGRDALPDHHHSAATCGGGPPAPIPVSAVTGEGLDTLLHRIGAELGARWRAPTADAPLVTRARQRHALERAREELAFFSEAWDTGALPAPVAAVHIRAAAYHLEELIGAVDVEDVLGRLFGEFCVGK